MIRVLTLIAVAASLSMVSCATKGSCCSSGSKAKAKACCATADKANAKKSDCSSCDVKPAAKKKA